MLGGPPGIMFAQDLRNRVGIHVLGLAQQPVGLREVPGRLLVQASLQGCEPSLPLSMQRQPLSAAHAQPCTPPVLGGGSDGSSDRPGCELGRAEIKQLTLRALARCHTQDVLEDPFTRLLHRLGPIEDRAAVDVHVLFHALEQGRVGRDLDRGCRLAAEHAAAVSGEAHEVRTARHLPSRGNWIEAMESEPG